jgi:hypothetical protein
MVVISDKTRERGAWLFAIDCATGEIGAKVSLSTFTELKDDYAQKISMTNSFIAQNSSALLTHVGWETNNTSGDWYGAYALIDKSTGKVTTLIKGLTIQGFDGFPRHQPSCVEVIQDEFYMLARRGARHESWPKYELLRMDAKGKQTFLTKLGRKPELTPFDLEDRPPNAMVRQNGGLLIYDETKRNMARYDAKGQVWATLEADDNKKNEDVKAAMLKAFQDRIAQSGKVNMPDGKTQLEIKGDGGIWPGQRIFLPSLLAVDMPGRKNVEIPLHFDYPDDYSKKARFVDDAGFNMMLPDTVSTVGQLQERKRLHPLIVCQTETDLIIALRIKPLRQGFDEYDAFLPFLWKLPKGELFNYLGIPVSK